MAARNIAKKSTPRKAPGRREAKAAAPAAAGTTTTVKTAAPVATSKPVTDSGGLAGRKDDLARYLKGVKGEFNRVTWPGNTNSFMKSLTSTEMKNATLVVITTLLLFSVYLGVLDALLIRIFGWVRR